MLWLQRQFKQGCRDKRGVNEWGICTDSILKMCFSYTKPILHRALHSLAGELMNSRSRYTVESKAIVYVIRKCAPFSWRQQQQAEFEPENPQAELSWHRSLFQLFIPMLSEQSNKSLGLRTMELIAIFFVNAIACKKRFCSPIFQFQPEGPRAISTSLWFGIP